MRASRLLLLLLLGSSCTFAYPRPPIGTEDIPALMAESTLVCKGEVVQAPPLTFTRSSDSVPRMTAVAEVRPDRCFKGTPPRSSIPVLFDGLVPVGGGPFFVLQKGDYRLFFLKPQNSRYAVSSQWFGALPISRQLGTVPERADSMYLLELDLKAGLADSDPERVLDSIRMLGNMKKLHSTRELDSPDLLVQAHVWQAFLRLKDYSVLPAVAEFFERQPDPPENLLLPQDRLFAIQVELQSEIAGIRDPGTLPYLERFAARGHDYHLRDFALQALRAMYSLHSAATFLRELDDPNSDNGFSAMQGPLSLAGGGAIAWVPTWEQFKEAPPFYAGKCREWWNTEAKRKPLLQIL
jgi:hypothetical protein